MLVAHFSLAFPFFMSHIQGVWCLLQYDLILSLWWEAVFVCFQAKTTFGGKGLFGLHILLLRESRTGTQGRNLWAGTKAEAEEEHVYWVFLGSRSACFFFLPGTSCPRVVHPTELDPSTSIINQDVPQMWQLARPIKTVPQLMVPLPRYF